MSYRSRQQGNRTKMHLAECLLNSKETDSCISLDNDNSLETTSLVQQLSM